MMNELNENFSLKEFFIKTLEFYFSILEYVLKSLIKFWYIPLIIGVLFVFGFYTKSKSIEPIFSAKTSYTFNCLNKKVFGDLLYDIEKSVNKSDFIAVSKLLNIPLETARTIKKFKAINIVGSPLNEDFTDSHIPFYIDVEFANTDNLSLIQNGITNFMRNDKFVKNKIHDKLSFKKNKLELINNSIATLDSLRRKVQVEHIEQFEKLMILSNTKLEEKNHISNMLKYDKAVDVLKPFVAIKIDKNLIIKKLAIKYSTIYLFLAIFITSLLNWYKSKSNVG